FCVNATADIEYENNTKSKFIGNPTECALLVKALDEGIDYKQLRQDTEIVKVFSFSSETKNMTTVIRREGKNFVLTKGSPERILEICDISDTERDKVLQSIMYCQERAERVIAFAHSITDSPNNDRADLEKNMTFDGFVSISDPLRDDVLDAVKECKRAGIELKMLTGDNIVTASAIAKKLGLLDGGGIAIEARELEALSDDEFDKMIAKVRVIARSTPLIKMRVVTALKALGNVVAVTGDGINDAPALKCADVGIAMGIAGTEVSKEASDIVLLDDSFATIAVAVKWGRGIYQNLQRFIQYSLATNIAIVLIILFSTLSGQGTPFTALQILWINVIMLDGPPAMTLGMEPMRGDIMSKKPIQRDDNIISKTMLVKMLLTAIMLTAIFMVQQFFNFLRIDEYQMSSALLTLFIITALFTAFNAREFGADSIFKNLFRNKLFWVAMPIVMVMQIVFTQFGGAIFGTVPLSFVTWIKILGLAVGVVIVSEAVKFAVRIYYGYRKVDI
ncbi:MAG: cation-translocating P-type ATPase, partial [Firmicutes bacterium]|nr:cation-translocating P-type ATPase [Bacillota bacterium]